MSYAASQKNVQKSIKTLYEKYSRVLIKKLSGYTKRRYVV